MVYSESTISALVPQDSPGLLELKSIIDNIDDSKLLACL